MNSNQISPPSARLNSAAEPFVGEYPDSISVYTLQKAHSVIELVKRPATIEAETSSGVVLDISARANRTYEIVSAIERLEKGDHVDVLDPNEDINIPQTRGTITTNLQNILYPIARRKRLQVDPEGEYGRIFIGVVNWVEKGILSRISGLLEKDGIVIKNSGDQEFLLNRLVAPIYKKEKEVLDTQFAMSHILYKLLDFAGWQEGGPVFLRELVVVTPGSDQNFAAQYQFLAMYMRNLWKDCGIDISEMAQAYLLAIKGPMSEYNGQNLDADTFNIIMDIERTKGIERLSGLYSPVIKQWMGNNTLGSMVYFVLARLAQITPQSKVEEIAKRVMSLRDQATE